MSPRTRVLAALVALLAAGCGGSSGPAPEDEVRDVAIRWNEALASGDGATACALLTEESVAKIEQPYRPEIPTGRNARPIRRELRGIGHPAQECEEAYSGRQAFGEIGAVEESGDHAVAELITQDSGGKVSKGELPLVQQEGEWRVDLIGFVRRLDFPED